MDDKDDNSNDDIGNDDIGNDDNEGHLDDVNEDVNEPELHKQPWWQVPAKSGCCRNGESGLAPRPCPSSPDHDNDHNDDNYDDDDDNDDDEEDYDAVMMNMIENADYLMIVKGRHEAKHNAGNGEQVEHCV